MAAGRGAAWCLVTLQDPSVVLLTRPQTCHSGTVYPVTFPTGYDLAHSYPLTFSRGYALAHSYPFTFPRDMHWRTHIPLLFPLRMPWRTHIVLLFHGVLLGALTLHNLCGAFLKKSHRSAQRNRMTLLFKIFALSS